MATLIWSILAVRSSVAVAEDSDRLWQIAVWGAVLTGIVLALGIGIVLARRRYLKFRGPVSEAKAKGFGIEQVESLHDSGQISDQEFRILRKTALGLDSGMVKKDNSPLSEMAASDDDSSDKGEEDLHTDIDEEQE